jgi:cytochrome c2
VSARAGCAAVLALAALLAACGRSGASAGGVEGDPARGRIALAQYGCQSCHMIKGVTGPRVYVGPSLEEFAQRKFIAGRIPNNHANLVRWIRNPQEFDPPTAMPALDVTQQDASDMAAYLLTGK